MIGSCKGIEGPCIIENIVNMAGLSFTGNLFVDLNMGGVIGAINSISFESFVKNCVNYGTIVDTGSYECNHNGGIVGIVGWDSQMESYLSDCTNYGTIIVNSTTKYNEQDSYMRTGGIVGEVLAAFISNCVSAGEIRVANRTLEFVGAFVGLLNNPTRLNHCFWVNNTGYDGYGANWIWGIETDLNLTQIDLGSEEDARGFVNRSEGGNASSTWTIVHLNGGKINNYAEETLVVTQRRLPEPVKEGNAFLCWCEDIYCATGRGTNESSSSSGGKELHAIWETSTVTFNLTNGTTLTKTYPFNESIDYPEVTETREGYVHKWDQRPKRMPGADITITAVWEKASYHVEIVFGTKELSRKGVEEFLKKYTDDEFVIVKFEDSRAEGVRVIVKFTDIEEASEFIEAVSEASEAKQLIAKVSFVFGELDSLSMHFAPLSVLSLFLF